MMHYFSRKNLGLAAVVIVALLALATAALAAPEGQTVSPNAGYPTNSITVSGVGQAFGAPDVAYVQLGVNFAEANISEAFSRANTTMEAVIAAIKALGIEDRDIQTSGVNIYPQDIYGPEGGPTGERTYNVSNTVSVTVRDVELADDVINTGIEAGANNVYGLSFGIDDTSTLEQDARLQAIEDARTRAQQLADALGLSVGAPIIVSETFGQGFGPVFDRAQAMGGGGVPVEQGQLSVNVQVEVTFAIGE
jgi:uncharacterized protein